MAAAALRTPPDPARLDRGQRDLPLRLHARHGVLLRDAPAPPDARRRHRDPLLRLRADPRQAHDPDVEQAREIRRPRDLHARRRLCLHGRLHDVQGGDVEQPGDLARARLGDAAGARRLHPPPARAHAQAAVQAPLRVGRSGRPVPRRDGRRREAREAPEADRERQRRHGVLPFLLGDVRPGVAGREEARGQRLLPVLPSRLLPPMAALGAPFLLLQQSLLPEERRADGGPGRARADEMVLGVPRSRGPVHGTDGRGNAGEVLLRLLGGAAGPDVHVLPLDRRGQGPARQRLLRHRGVEAVSVRLLEEQDARRGQPAADPHGAFPPPEDLPEALPPDARVLLDLPQGRADPGAQQLPLDARAEPLRHLVRLGSLRPRRALLLRPAADEGLPGLSPPPLPLRRVR